MSALPLLVEWGNVISKLVVGGVAGLALLGYRALRNHRDLKPARADARRMSLAVDEPREGPIAMRGTYRSANDERWLECSGQRVALAGDLAIVRGSAATWKGSSRTYTLRDGDSVIAIGRMERRANAEATDYRALAGGWELAASAGESAIQLCIASPVPCPTPLWPIRGIAMLAVAGACAYFGLGYVGRKLVERRHYPREAFLEGDGASTFAAEIACALPRAREAALWRYSTDLRYKPQTEEVLAQRVAIEQTEYCQGAVDLLYELKRFEQAAEVARGCGHAEYGRPSLVALGKYEDAAAITEPIKGFFRDDPLIGMIGAGRWREAAAYVENRDHGDDAESDRCLGLYFKSLVAGELSEKPSGTGKVCRFVDGVFDDPQDEYDTSISIARWAFGDGRGEFIDPEDIAIWLAPHVAWDDYSTHAIRAERAMVLGQFDVAAAEVEQAFATRGPVEKDAERWWTWRDRQLTNMLALRTGKPIEAFEPDPPDGESRPDRITDADAAALIRSGAPAAKASKLAYAEPRIADAIDAAGSGDGLRLARAFESYADSLGLRVEAEFLLAIAPKVTSHREELARAIRNRRLFTGLAITSTVHDLSLERDTLRMLGDKAGADRLQTIIDRHAKAFADPAKIKALLLAKMH